MLNRLANNIKAAGESNHDNPLATYDSGTYHAKAVFLLTWLNLRFRAYKRYGQPLCQM